jgi:hypothetical protein
VLTVVGWNALAAVVLLAWAGLTLGRAHPSDGEDWSSLVFAILVVIGGGALALGTAVGGAIAFVLMRRRLATAATPVGPRTAIVTGTGATVLGWLTGIVAAGVFVFAVTRVTS